MKIKNIELRIKKHEGAVIAFIAFIILMNYGESQINNYSCSIKNPTFPCSNKGLIDISQIYNNNFTQTTGLGTHYINGIPAYEFRGSGDNIYGGYQHVICDLGNSTCEWHLDKYPALDFPFGFVLHIADSLNFYLGLLSEELWQVLVWAVIVIIFYFIARFMEKKLEK